MSDDVRTAFVFVAEVLGLLARGWQIVAIFHKRRSSMLGFVPAIKLPDYSVRFAWKHPTTYFFADPELQQVLTHAGALVVDAELSKVLIG